VASLGPISRRELIRAFRAAGFSGPFAGGSHEYMEKGPLRVRIPNPHSGDIPLPLLRRILKEAGITPQEWQAL
jgi:predicted RNA binding protein YcfA (HicA-like mRNA interferase family)